ncbi:MAG: potassium-transporting ATPase subunit KdpC [Acidimicrobiales bacterium]
MRRVVRAALAMLVGLSVLTGLAYPLALTGLAQVSMPGRANGSLLYARGHAVGSALIGQAFTNATGQPLPQYFQPRPSAAHYDALASGGSNLGPSNPVLLRSVARLARAYRAFNHLAPRTPVPVDAVTTSGSGLDPDISIANALLQVPRVAAARHLRRALVRALVQRYTQGRILGILGEPVVNVLELNLALDRLGRQ